MVKLKYLLFLFIILFSSNVFAAEFNMNSYTSATKTGTKNRYRATEIYNTGISNTYTFGTQYSGRISDIETYFSYPFSANMTYRLTYNMNTDDFRNNFGSSYWWDCDHEMTNTNATVQSVNYVSYRKVTFTFTPSSATTCIRVWLRSKDLSNTAITGISNWRLNNITIYDPEWQNGSSSSSGSQGSSSGSSGTSSTNNTDEIINNATENTHTIVDNQNQNTEDIINNNNQNTEAIIESQQEINDTLNSNCKSGLNFYDVDTYHFVNGFINSDGLVTSNPNYLASPFFKIKGGEIYTINVGQTRDIPYFCWYYGNKGKISCTPYNNTRQFTVTAPDSAVYLRVTSIISAGNFIPVSIVGPVCNDWNLENQNNINDTITNPNIDNDVGTGFFDDFTSNDFGLSQIITIPLNTIQGLTSKSCVPLSIPIPFTNSNISLPCMTEIYQTKFSGIYNLWKIVSFGIISYFIAIDIFHIVKGFKDPESDKVEVLDL